jgi:signal transduction histidine kinase
MYQASEIFYGVILATLVFFSLTVIAIVIVGRYYARKRSHELSLAQFDQVLLQSRIEIKEQTFKTISQELQDNLGETLTLAKLNLNRIKLENQADAQEKLNGAIDVLSHTIQSMRDLSRSLHAEIIQRNGLVNALEKETDLIRRLGVLQTSFHIGGNPIHIDDNKSLIIFRIVQEALHNVIRHSGATQLDLIMEFSKGVISLSIRDDGTGFSTERTFAGSGLRNMKDRAAIIGADFSITSARSTGTLVTLTIPDS